MVMGTVWPRLIVEVASVVRRGAQVRVRATARIESTASQTRMQGANQ